VNIIFGPIISRRFGKSLGIDLSPNIKQCNFDCLYCELKSSRPVKNYDDVISVDEILNQIQNALKLYKDIDVLTFTANGEPTLYPFLDELIKRVNKIKDNTKTLILSNASTISDLKIQKSLQQFDSVKLSLDCFSQKCFRKLDRGVGVDIQEIKHGIEEFSKIYKGELVIEVLVVKGINDKIEEIQKIGEFLKDVKPFRVDFGSIDRPPAYDVKGVEFEELLRLSLLFPKTLKVTITSKKPATTQKVYFSKEQILQTLKRRPLSQKDIKTLFDEEATANLKELLAESKISLVKMNEEEFFTLN
jgi:wyosine [tRNA(Phe)-imidazoG37] synthetase (radical SAM superfamily)